jgi:hypothetical protein
VIKYFFQDYLPSVQKNTLGDMVSQMADEILGAWNDTRTYACLAPTALTAWPAASTAPTGCRPTCRCRTRPSR